jgi:hypothetical protein
VLDAKVLKDKFDVPLKLSPQQRAFVLSLVLLVRLLSVYICRTSEHCDILINRPGRALLVILLLNESAGGRVSWDHWNSPWAAIPTKLLIAMQDNSWGPLIWGLELRGRLC